jgi:hypothetical protein
MQPLHGHCSEHEPLVTARSKGLCQSGCFWAAPGQHLTLSLTRTVFMAWRPAPSWHDGVHVTSLSQRKSQPSTASRALRALQPCQGGTQRIIHYKGLLQKASFYDRKLQPLWLTCIAAALARCRQKFRSAHCAAPTATHI